LKAIADTGFIVAYGIRDDYHHKWALDIAKKLTDPALTCEAVLAEAAFHLQSTGYVLSLVTSGMLAVKFDLAANLAAVADLATRYSDRKPDLADLCLIRMSELHPKRVLITIDESDFRVYRRNKREAIPILTPPRRH
jgi:predicted nucleic acid-binding protein